MRPLNHTVISFQTIGACTARLPDRVISGGEYSEGDTPPTVCNRSIFPICRENLEEVGGIRYTPPPRFSQPHTTAGRALFHLMSAFGGKADIGQRRFNVRL